MKSRLLPLLWIVRLPLVSVGFLPQPALGVPAAARSAAPVPGGTPAAASTSSAAVTNPAKSRPPPARYVTVATKPFGRDCGRISSDRHSTTILDNDLRLDIRNPLAGGEILDDSRNSQQAFCVLAHISDTRP